MKLYLQKKVYTRLCNTRTNVKMPKRNFNDPENVITAAFHMTMKISYTLNACAFDQIIFTNKMDKKHKFSYYICSVQFANLANLPIGRLLSRFANCAAQPANYQHSILDTSVETMNSKRSKVRDSTPCLENLENDTSKDFQIGRPICNLARLADWTEHI